tara:strand:- start:499 stop:666 length:168 start_codon:yes stop_codon:yes gene_type:complete
VDGRWGRLRYLPLIGLMLICTLVCVHRRALFLVAVLGAFGWAAFAAYDAASGVLR